ncbi:MAG: BBE domain-containing protein, partial [Proteobacteria bacterium]|nr:BBE domain-containing protein [Pseudomonadota bacterium]
EIMLVIVSGWTDPAQDDEAIAATREVYGKLDPFTGGYYSNIDTDRAKVTGNYGPAYDRLHAAKVEYDPGNLFRLNSNIDPA